MAPLNNKTVLVVGGSSGFGFAVAKAAHAEGATVIIASSSATRVQAAVDRLGAGDRVSGHVVNVLDEKAVAALLEGVGGVDHLVYTVRTDATQQIWRLCNADRRLALQAGDPKFGSGVFPNVDIDDVKEGWFGVRFFGRFLAARFDVKLVPYADTKKRE
jgi:NAD(P)-dependent dehydrogenase (short-subunit alcohol dehydrogenase family)